jgi:hypothetical protein
MTRRQIKTAKFDIRVTPQFKKQVLLAALANQTLTDWVEAALVLAMQRQLEKTERTDD